MKKHQITAIFFLILALVVSAITGADFLAKRAPTPIVRGLGVTEVRMLSEWFDGIKGTPGDTEVYVLDSGVKGASMLVLGGTHPNEPSSHIAAVLLIENAMPAAGTLYVIPRANASGFTHNDPQEGAPQSFSIPTAFGDRKFSYGSRATNPIHQWPDPNVYIHASSGQSLSGSETRNLNRGFPGRPNGTLTEKVCYAITEFIRERKVTITVDLHEASPEYPVINAIVAHPKAMGLASETVLGLEMQDITIGLEPSPVNLRGLTHRELGDFTDTLPVLMETANASQGRLRGRTDEALVLTGKDPWYVRAQKLGRLYVPYDENGHPLKQRVGRHIAGIQELAFSWTLNNPDVPIEFLSVPSYVDLMERGIGPYLLSSVTKLVGQ
jgi:hypothetical protein